MLNLHCNKNGKKKIIITKPNKYVFKIHRGVHYAMEADGINRKKIIYAKVINRRVGKMCNPHPLKSNALGKHM